jgi:hypothetical protein
MRRPLSSLALAFSLLSLVSLLALPSACSDDAQFTTRFASDFSPSLHTVSVLGVFKDGQMSTEAWESLGSKLSTPFGATCDTAYAGLVTTNQSLSSAIDDYVRANGPGDELLEQLSPAATGDLIAVFTVAGHVAGKAAPPPDTTAVQQSSPMTGAGGGKYRGARPGGVNGGRGMPKAPAIASFEVSVSFYSVSQKRAVGLLALQYEGTSQDEALQRMAQKLGLTLPSARCAGWDWKAKVDDNRIRALIEQ